MAVADKWSVARALDEIAHYVELSDPNPFRARAFERAARAVEGLERDLGELVRSPDLYKTSGIGTIREACGAGMTIVTPGIRPEGSDAGDQRRTLTPAEAIRAGADYIVVGRPITGAKDRRAAALRIVDQMERAG